MEMSKLTWDGTAEPVSQEQILRRERGQEKINFPYSADHEQDWQPYPVDPYSYHMCDHACICLFTRAAAHVSFESVINCLFQRAAARGLYGAESAISSSTLTAAALV